MSADRPAWRRDGVRHAGLAAVLVAVTCLAYGRVVDAGFIWDDDDYVEHNALLHEPGGLARIWTDPLASPQYYPLVHTSFWIERRLFGPGARSFHVTNVLLHALNALLLAALVSRLRLPGAWPAAFLFALHPVHVESVAWITERKNVLSLALYLAAAHALLTFESRQATGRPWRLPWALAALAFGGALLSKSVTCSLPAAWLLMLYWRRGRLRIQDVLAVLPLFVMGAAAAWSTARLEVVHVNAEGLEWAWTPLERLLIAVRAVWFYALKLIWPDPLVFIYPRWSVSSPGAMAWLAAAGLLAAFVAAALAARRGRRGPFVALSFFVGTLTPALGFVNVYPMLFSLVADHFQYHASLGVIVAVSAVATVHCGGMKRGVAPALLVAVLLALGWRTAVRTEAYRDRETLWTTTTTDNPGAWMAWNNLGHERMTQGDVKGATADFERALALRSPYPDAENNLGMARFALGETDAARRHYENVLAVRPRDPAALNNIGNVHLAQGRPAEAIECFERALAAAAADRKRRPQTNADFNLGVALAAVGRHGEALERFIKVLARRPGDGPAHYRAALSLRALGRPAEALPHDERVVALYPEHADARIGLAISLGTLGRIDAAAAELVEVLRRRPGHAGAHRNLATAAAQHDPAGGVPAALRFIEGVLAGLPFERAPVASALAELMRGAGRPADAQAATDAATRYQSAASTGRQP